MKKILFTSLLVANIVSFAYTESDISNADFLARENIIVAQPSGDKYRLNDTITRAEVVGIAMKIKGAVLPEKYTCKDYFSDVKYDAKNNWICRAVELASDDGIVSKSNKKFRPQDTISRAEALAIITQSTGIKIHPFAETPTKHLTINGQILQNPLAYEKAAGKYQEFKTNDFSDWQINLLLTLPCEIYTNFSCSRNGDNATLDTAINSEINSKATREEVINYATNILINYKSEDIGILYFQQMNDVGFEMPKNWSVGNFGNTIFRPKISAKGLEITTEKYDFYNLALSIIADSATRENFLRPSVDSPMYDVSVSSKEEMNINGLEALKYKINVDDVVGTSTRIEWFIFLGEEKVLKISGWLRIRDEKDYSELFLAIEKMVQGITNL